MYAPHMDPPPHVPFPGYEYGMMGTGMYMPHYMGMQSGMAGAHTPASKLGKKPAGPKRHANGYEGGLVPSTALLNGQCMAESITALQRRNAINSRKHMKKSTACAQCRKSKLRCDEGRPCRRCIRAGKEHQCLPVGVVAVDRPMGSTDYFSISYQQTPVVDPDIVLPNVVFRAIEQLGMRENEVVSIFTKLPKWAAERLLEGMGVLSKSMEMKEKRALEMAKNSNTTRDEAESYVDDDDRRILDVEGPNWQRDPKYARIVREHDRDSNTIKTMVNANLLSISGCTDNEGANRFCQDSASNDLPNRYNDVEGLCMLLETALTLEEPKVVRYASIRKDFINPHQCTPPPMMPAQECTEKKCEKRWCKCHAVLVKETYVRKFDEAGREIKCGVEIEYITGDEWDRACRETPELVRPMMSKLVGQSTSCEVVLGNKVPAVQCLMTGFMTTRLAALVNHFRERCTQVAAQLDGKLVFKEEADVEGAHSVQTEAVKGASMTEELNFLTSEMSHEQMMGSTAFPQSPNIEMWDDFATDAFAQPNVHIEVVQQKQVATPCPQAEIEKGTCTAADVLVGGTEGCAGRSEGAYMVDPTNEEALSVQATPPFMDSVDEDGMASGLFDDFFVDESSRQDEEPVLSRGISELTRGLSDQWGDPFSKNVAQEGALFDDYHQAFGDNDIGDMFAY